MSRLNCRFGVKIATPESVVSGLLTPPAAARIPSGSRLVSLDATLVMHPSAALFDQAMALTRLEELALAEEDIDRAEELADRRAGLLFDAWRLREGYAENLLMEHLRKLQTAQRHLQDCAEALRAKLAGQMSTERKQAKYFDGYRHANAQSQKAFYFDKRS